MLSVAKGRGREGEPVCCPVPGRGRGYRVGRPVPSPWLGAGGAGLEANCCMHAGRLPSSHGGRKQIIATETGPGNSPPPETRTSHRPQLLIWGPHCTHDPRVQPVSEGQEPCDITALHSDVTSGGFRDAHELAHGNKTCRSTLPDTPMQTTAGQQLHGAVVRLCCWWCKIGLSWTKPWCCWRYAVSVMNKHEILGCLETGADLLL